MNKEVIKHLREIKKSLSIAANRIEDLIELADHNNICSDNDILEDIKKVFSQQINVNNTSVVSNKLLTAKDVAKLMHIDLAKVYRLIKGGYIKSLKLGERGMRIPESEYNKFIEENLGNDLSKIID